MKKQPPVKRNNQKGVAWGKRGGITLPEDMYDFVMAEAEKRKMPVYQFVMTAVEFYARAFPPKDTTDARP